MSDGAISGADRIFESISAGNVSAVRDLLAGDGGLASVRNEQGVSAVMFALYHQQQEIVDALLAVHGDVDVFEAAGLGDVGQLRQLLGDSDELVSSYSADGFTPLALACYFGRAEATAFLIEAGADVDAVSRNGAELRPLHGAVAGRHTDVVRLLLESGANPNVKQMGGWTPLHGAANHGDVGQVRLLLAHGGDRSMQSDDGKTARDMAAAKGFDAVVTLLDDA